MVQRVRVLLWFQSTPRTGSDTRLGIRPYAGFNPRPRTGSDQRLLFTHLCFNPTGHSCWSTASFNPRPRTGSDKKDDRHVIDSHFGTRIGHKKSHHWFQSTPPHGERPRRRFALILSFRGFNPRPRTGSDHGICQPVARV
jgi:hypothetical protein